MPPPNNSTMGVTVYLFGVYLRVQRRGLKAELMDVSEERPIELFPGWWDVQAALPLLFSHNFCIAWRS